MTTLRKVALVSFLATATAVAATSSAQAQGKTITLCWAAWDPANALVELSKDFTAETGIKMKFEFVPWPNFADRMLNELNSKGKLCDLMIGDSQWIGGSAENGHYVKLNDFFAKEGIKMDDFMPATVIGYSEWPKGTPNYWALPAMGDADRLDLSQGLVRPTRDPGRVQGEVQPRPRAAEDLGRAQADRRVLPGPRDRRQEGLRRRDLHRARLGRHHDGRDQRALSVRLQVPGPEEALCHGRLRQLRRTP